MRIFLITLFLCLNTVFSQTAEPQQEPTKTLETLLQKLNQKDYENAKEHLIDKNISQESLDDLQKVISKVLNYIQAGLIVPVHEGSRQYSINLRGSVLFLLKENGKLYLTKGTTSKISLLLEKAHLLNTPEKTMDFFIEHIKNGDLEGASSSFVAIKENQTIEQNNANNFSEILQYLRKKNIEGEYQGIEEKSLVSFPIMDKSISLAKENDDWLFTITTRENIPLIYKKFKDKHMNSLFPSWLDDKMFLIKNWQWAGIFLILLIGIIVQWIFKAMIKKAINRKIDDENKKDNSQKFHSITILCVSLCWYFMFPLLGLDKEIAEILQNAAGIMAMVSALFVVFKVLDFFKSWSS